MRVPIRSFLTGVSICEYEAVLSRGRIPINPSSKLKAKECPIGATGVRQALEIVLQHSSCGFRNRETGDALCFLQIMPRRIPITEKVPDFLPNSRRRDSIGMQVIRGLSSLSLEFWALQCKLNSTDLTHSMPPGGQGQTGLSAGSPRISIRQYFGHAQIMFIEPIDLARHDMIAQEC